MSLVQLTDLLASQAGGVKFGQIKMSAPCGRFGLVGCVSLVGFTLLVIFMIVCLHSSVS
jgi:hypothetical protein